LAKVNWPDDRSLGRFSVGANHRLMSNGTASPDSPSRRTRRVEPLVAEDVKMLKGAIEVLSGSDFPVVRLRNTANHIDVFSVRIGP